jgi:hypothetical protein
MLGPTSTYIIWLIFKVLELYLPLAKKSLQCWILATYNLLSLLGFKLYDDFGLGN